MNIVEIIVFVIGIYLTVGILFAVWFVIFGITKLDESAKATGFAFRIIIIFGIVVFWVLFAKRLLFHETLPTENNAHRRKSLEAK